MSKVTNTQIDKGYEKKLCKNKMANITLDNGDNDLNFLMDRILYIYICVFISYVLLCSIY